jgi:hypothetical protein
MRRFVPTAAMLSLAVLSLALLTPAQAGTPACAAAPPGQVYWLRGEAGMPGGARATSAGVGVVVSSSAIRVMAHPSLQVAP